MTNSQTVAVLERVNYAALLPVTEATPGLDLVMQDDVVLSSSVVFPSPDTTHACLLQATPDTADEVIDRVIAYFSERELPTTIYLSPACAPDDLAERLTARGFVQNEHPEAWMVLDDLAQAEFLSTRDDVHIAAITPDQTQTFAEIFLAAFEQPVEFAGVLADLLRPSVNLPTASHYLAQVNGEFAGTISLIRHESYGIIGSGGVLPEYRNRGLFVDLCRTLHTDAQANGVTTLLTQVEPQSAVERFFLRNSFEQSFVRYAYTLMT